MTDPMFEVLTGGGGRSAGMVLLNLVERDGLLLQLIGRICARWEPRRNLLRGSDTAA